MDKSTALRPRKQIPANSLEAFKIIKLLCHNLRNIAVSLGTFECHELSEVAATIQSTAEAGINVTDQQCVDLVAENKKLKDLIRANLSKIHFSTVTDLPLHIWTKQFLEQHNIKLK